MKTSLATAALALALATTPAHATTFTYDHVTIPPLFVDVIVKNGPPAAPKLIGDGLLILHHGSHEAGDYQQQQQKQQILVPTQTRIE